MIENYKSNFNQVYKTLKEKTDFLKSFNLLNLQKAAKIGKIPQTKTKTKEDAIAAIINFDQKNKFLICKTMYEWEDEYRKEKPEDIFVIMSHENSSNEEQVGQEMYDMEPWEKSNTNENHIFDVNEMKLNELRKNREVRNIFDETKEIILNKKVLSKLDKYWINVSTSVNVNYLKKKK